MLPSLSPGECPHAAFHPVYGWADIDVLADGEIELHRPGGESGDFQVIGHSLILYPDGSHDDHDSTPFPPILTREYALDFLDANFGDERDDQLVLRALCGDADFWREQLPRIPEDQKLSEALLSALDHLSIARRGRALRAADLEKVSAVFQAAGGSTSAKPSRTPLPPREGFSSSAPKAPRIKARRVQAPDGTLRLKFWCAYCRTHHTQEIGPQLSDGVQRAAPCTNPASPLKETGLVLVES
jgi:hypothetical protein